MITTAPTTRKRDLEDSWSLPVRIPFTAVTAGEAGVTSHQLRWLVNEGYVRHLIKSVYVASQVPDSVALRCAALGLVMPEDCVVVDRHAGWLRGAQMILAPNEHVELRPISVFRPSGHGRLRNGLANSGERNLTDEDVTEINGLRVTTPLRTAWDLGRVRWTGEAISGLDAMFRLGAFSRGEFLDGIERFKGMRFVTTLRVIGPLADGRSESPGESVLRLRWIETHLGTPVPQVEVWRHGILIAILDIADERLRYAVEYDGVEWHSSPEQVVHDAERRLAVNGEDWVVDVFGSADLYGQGVNPEAKIRQGMAIAQRMYGSRAS